MFDFNNLPQPILDLLQMAKQALDFANKNLKQLSHSQYIEKAGHFFSRFATKEGIGELSETFNNINIWFKTHIGFTFLEIFRVIGKVFVWVLEKFTSFLKGIVK